LRRPGRACPTAFRFRALQTSSTPVRANTIVRILICSPDERSGQSAAQSAPPRLWPAKQGHSRQSARPQRHSREPTPGQRSGESRNRATAGAGPRQGELQLSLWGRSQDRRPREDHGQPQTNIRICGQTRESELDHRRLKASLPPLHDHPPRRSPTKIVGRKRARVLSLDKGLRAKSGVIISRSVTRSRIARRSAALHPGYEFSGAATERSR